MYKRGVLENDYGYGAAIGVALLVIVSLATIIYMQLQNRQEGWGDRALFPDLHSRGHCGHHGLAR